MPDQFGNPTPEETFQSIMLQKENIKLRARSPAERRSANFGLTMAAATKGINPQMVRAEEIQTALQTSQQGISQKEGESQLDFNQRRLTAMYREVAPVDGDTAAKIADQLGALEQEKAARKLLTQQTANAALLHDKETFALETAKEIGNTRMLLNPSNPNDDPRQYDLADPAERKAYEEFKNEKGDRLDLTMEEASKHFLQASRQAAARQARGKLGGGITNGDLNDRITSLDNNSGLLSNVNTAIDVMQDTDFRGMTVVSKGAALAARVNTNVADARVKISENRGNTASDNAHLEKYWEQLVVENGLNRENDAVTRLRGQFERLAYTLAKSFDDNGRLSDEDVRRAYLMLGTGGQNPRLVMESIYDTVEGMIEANLITQEASAMSLIQFGHADAGGRLQFHTGKTRREYDAYIRRHNQVLNQLTTDPTPEAGTPPSTYGEMGWGAASPDNVTERGTR